MTILGIDLGGTKLVASLFTVEGKVVVHESFLLGERQGTEVGLLITRVIRNMLKTSDSQGNRTMAIGISVPGISFSKKGTVWAPNIRGWEDYPLLNEVKSIAGNIPVTIDNDRGMLHAWRSLAG